MVPNVILLALVIGVFAYRRPTVVLAAVAALGAAWGLLIATVGDGDFAGAFVLGAANAAVGVVFGAGIGSLGTSLCNSLHRQRCWRLPRSRSS